MLLSRQAGGDSAATLYPSLPRTLTPSIPASPTLQQSLSPSPSRLAPSPSLVPYPWGSGAEQTNTGESIFSPSLSPPLCLHLSIPPSMSPWPACSANKWRARLSVGKEDNGKGRSERRRKRRRRRRRGLQHSLSLLFQSSHHFSSTVLPLPLSIVCFPLFYHSITLFTHKGQFKRVGYF